MIYNLNMKVPKVRIISICDCWLCVREKDKIDIFKAVQINTRINEVLPSDDSCLRLWISSLLAENALTPKNSLLFHK